MVVAMTLVWLMFWIILCLFCLSIVMTLLCRNTTQKQYAYLSLSSAYKIRSASIGMFCFLAIISYTSAVITADGLLFHHIRAHYVHKAAENK